MKFLILRKGRRSRGISTLLTRSTRKSTLFAAGGRYLRNVGADNKITRPYRGMKSGWNTKETILASLSSMVILPSSFILCPE